VGEDREKLKPESTEDVEAHKLIAERAELGKLQDEEREVLPTEDVEGHALIDDKTDALRDNLRD
jgi:hypothetical protein